MNWLIFIPGVLIILFFYYLYQKKINREEKQTTFHKPGSNQYYNSEKDSFENLTYRFKKYLDFHIVNEERNVFEINNPKNETILIHRQLTDIVVVYKLNNSKVKEWKFPFWVHPNVIFKTVDEDYRKSLQPISSKQDTLKWEVSQVRPFTQQEIDSIEIMKVVSSQYGKSVEFKMKQGGVIYIPLYPTENIPEGDSIDPNSVELLTLSKRGEKDIFRVKLKTTPIS